MIWFPLLVHWREQFLRTHEWTCDGGRSRVIFAAGAASDLDQSVNQKILKPAKLMSFQYPRNSIWPRWFEHLNSNWQCERFSSRASPAKSAISWHIRSRFSISRVTDILSSLCHQRVSSVCRTRCVHSPTHPHIHPWNENPSPLRQNQICLRSTYLISLRSRRSTDDWLRSLARW